MSAHAIAHKTFDGRPGTPGIWVTLCEGVETPSPNIETASNHEAVTCPECARKLLQMGCGTRWDIDSKLVETLKQIAGVAGAKDGESDRPPVPRPSRDRAAWLFHPVSSIGRLKIDFSQYEELRSEARALKDENDAVLVAGEELLRSLGEFVRQSMHSNPEWKSGIEAMEKVLFEAKKARKP